MAERDIQLEIRYPPAIRILNLAGILIMLSMAFIGWMAYSQEAVSWGLPTAVIMIIISLFWLLALAATPKVIQFGREQLTIRRWLGTSTLAYRDIIAVRQSHPFLTLVTPDKTIRLYKLYANTDAIIMTTFEKFIPVANAIQEKRLYPTLPFSYKSALTGPIVSFVLSWVLIAFGFSAIYFTFTEPDSIESWQWVCIPLIALMSFGFGLLLLYLFLRQFVRKYVFTPSEIRLHHPLHITRHPAQGLQGVRVKEDPRKVRGVDRTVYQLELLYNDGSIVLLEPNGFSFPMDYIDAKEAQITAELATQIRHAYSLNPEKPHAPAAKPVVSAAPKPQHPKPIRGNPLPPLAPASPTHTLLQEVLEMEESDYFTEFETLRDKFLALGPEAMPIILNAARQHGDNHIVDLLVTVLADIAYPPAMPVMVEWLNHPNEEVRFAAAFTLDNLADGRFNIEAMIVDGWVQHDQIQAVAPQILQWYHAEGHKNVPSLTQWLAKRAAMPTYTEQEKRYNFIEMNPRWVMLGSGEVSQPQPDFQLPHHQGIHVIGGIVELPGETSSRPAVFEMESGQGNVQKIVIKENGRWLDVTRHVIKAIPHFRF